MLDTQRRRQVCVMLARLGLCDVPRALQQMDSESLDSEQVELLLTNLPSEDEMKLLQRAKEEHVIDDLHVAERQEMVETMDVHGHISI